jgi:hypothetical protein
MRDRLADKAPYQPQEAGKRKLKGKSEELIGCNRRKTFFSLFWGKGQRNCHLRCAQFALDYFVIKLNFSSLLGARLQRPFGSALLIFGIIRDNDERREKKNFAGIKVQTRRLCGRTSENRSIDFFPSLRLVFIAKVREPEPKKNIVDEQIKKSEKLLFIRFKSSGR